MGQDKGSTHPGIWNRSQFDLLEIRVHPDSVSVEDADNFTPDGLAQEAHLLVPEFRSGDLVTAVRRRVDVGELIAVTTAEPVEINGYGYTLVVFDTSFRLLSPASADNPFADVYPDGGPADGGDGDRMDGGDL